MAERVGNSEYGGQSGIIQPPTPQVGDKGGLTPGHSELSVNEAAQVARRAGIAEKGGVRANIVRDKEGNVISSEPYSEEQAYLDYINGQNKF